MVEEEETEDECMRKGGRVQSSAFERLAERPGVFCTVLLVEDDIVTCKIVADSLKACRYNGEPAPQAARALEHDSLKKAS